MREFYSQFKGKKKNIYSILTECDSINKDHNQLRCIRKSSDTKEAKAELKADDFVAHKQPVG